MDPSLGIGISTMHSSDKSKNRSHEVEKMDTEISRLSIAIAAIQDVVDRRLAEFRKQRNQITSAILPLPDEIISNVFLLLTRDIDSTHHTQTSSTSSVFFSFPCNS
ncbi:hypothetical protein FRC03_004261 [Tulasnella sp. 419]|nr:hypothetical protein FRC03_004261 [Tulasnella sp. 419]